MMRGAWSIRSWVSYVNRALESPGSCLGTTISVCTAVTIFGVMKLLRALIPDPQTVPIREGCNSYCNSTVSSAIERCAVSVALRLVRERRRDAREERAQKWHHLFDDRHDARLHERVGAFNVHRDVLCDGVSFGMLPLRHGSSKATPTTTPAPATSASRLLRVPSPEGVS